MDRAKVERRNRIILEIRAELRALGRPATASEIDSRFASKDPALHTSWRASQDAKHRRTIILQVLRNVRKPRAAAAGIPPASGTESPISTMHSPVLLWPLGMRQRKDAEPAFKLPHFYGSPGGSERVFLECLSDTTLHEVSATLHDRPVGYWPAIRPGAFVELSWKDDPDLAASVTYNGWREWLLQYETLKGLAGIGKDSDSSVTSRATWPMIEWARGQLERMKGVLPPDLNVWKGRRWGYRLEVGYLAAGSAVRGSLSGYLIMTMEDLWIRFKDDKGHAKSIQ